MNLVRDKGDDRAFKLLWNFQSENEMTMRNICHESFVGNCAGEMFGFLEEEKDGKEK